MSSLTKYTWLRASPPNLAFKGAVCTFLSSLHPIRQTAIALKKKKKIAQAFPFTLTWKLLKKRVSGSGAHFWARKMKVNRSLK